MSARPEAGTAALQSAWEANCLQRQRRELVPAIIGCGLLIPAWAGADLLLEARWAPWFLPLRAVATVVAWALYFLARRQARVSHLSALVSAMVTVALMCVALMLPVVEHFLVYLFGFSTIFWSMGLLLSWQVRWTVLAMVLGAGTLVLGFLAWPGARTAADYVVSAAYLGTVMVMATAANSLRRRLELRTFLAGEEVNERNRELKAALDRLADAQARLVASEKLSALGRLLAGLSHELNNPINVLQNTLGPAGEYQRQMLELLAVVRAGAPDALQVFSRRWEELELDYAVADAPWALDSMRVAVERIHHIYQDLRAFVRGDAPGRVEGDLNDGLLAALTLFSRQLPAGVRLEHQLGELPRFAFQPGQLNQVWSSLLENALEAVGERGAVAVSSRRVDGAVEVAVVDSGPGVAEAHRARLFEPFFTTKEVGQGTGLGLATSYQIVRRHGGTLVYDASHRPGARFVVRLPLRGPPAGPSP